MLVRTLVSAMHCSTPQMTMPRWLCGVLMVHITSLCNGLIQFLKQGIGNFPWQLKIQIMRRCLPKDYLLTLHLEVQFNVEMVVQTLDFPCNHPGSIFDNLDV